MDSLREKWFALLPDSGKGRRVPGGQPFWLFALSQSLRLMGDPDGDIIDNSPGSSFPEGVHLGHLEALGPTPQVYRPREKEPFCDESEYPKFRGGFQMDYVGYWVGCSRFELGFSEKRTHLSSLWRTHRLTAG